MSIKAWIPNMLTLGNLGCGVVAITVLFDRTWPNPVVTIAILMGIAMVCDFLDGFVARLLKATSPIGKELDSLADMVTFGVLPGLLMYETIRFGLAMQVNTRDFLPSAWTLLTHQFPWYQALLPYAGLLIPLFSAVRLAKFNVDTRQSSGFLGLPTPANAFFFLSLFLIALLDGALEDLPRRHYVYGNEGMPPDPHWIWPAISWATNPYVLAGLAAVFSVLLVLEIPLMAFKFKTYAFKDHWPKYTFLGFCVILLALMGYRAGPFIILLYFVFSFIDASRK